MRKPLATVVVPTHNRARMLVWALDSLARQTVRDFETIVVDDGSTEDVRGVACAHPLRPIILTQPHRGPAAARNAGIIRAAADRIAFLDSDDEWLPMKLERFLQAMDRQPHIPIWYGPMAPIAVDGRPVPGRTKPCRSGRVTQELFESSFVHVPTVVCNRAVLEEFEGFDPALPVCEDYDLWLRVSTRHEFGLIDEPLALRRLHDDRLSKSSMRRNLAIKAEVLERFYYSPAGRDQLDSERARRRLGQVFAAAGRAALRERCFDDAIQLLSHGRSHDPEHRGIRTLSALARILRAIGLERTPPLTGFAPAATRDLRPRSMSVSTRQPSQPAA